MKTLEYRVNEPAVIRTHPWTEALSNRDHRYYDFKTEPGLIRTSLEDFIPFSNWPAIANFYDLLEWINAPDSILESNDCGMQGPGKNKSLNFSKTLECTARLMILYRHLPYNTNAGTVKWLADALRHYLQSIDSAFEWGVVSTTQLPTQYVTLPVPADQQIGSLVMLKFWAWGDSENEVMENFGRTVSNTRIALEGVTSEIIETQSRGS